MSLINSSDADQDAIVEISSTGNSPLVFKSWLDQYQLIHHLILYSNILMVLQGKKGAGKTTYIKHLVEKLPEDFLCQTISSKDIESCEALSLNLRQLFSLSSLNSSSDSQNTDHDLVEQIAKRQKHCLLIIDDAHFLNNEVITALLSCLQGQTENVYFHCLFVGDPLLSSRLSQPPFTGCLESFTHIIDLPELEVSDVKNFLKKVFSSLGTMPVSTLSDACLLDILSQSNNDLTKLTQLAQEQLSGSSVLNTPSMNFLKAPTYQKRGMATLVVAFTFIVFAFVRAPNTSLPKTHRLALPSQNLPFETMNQEVQQARFKDRPELSPTIDLVNNKIETKVEPTKAVQPAQLPQKLSYVPMSMIPKHTLLTKKILKKPKPTVVANISKQEKLKGEKQGQQLLLTSKTLKSRIINRMESAPLAEPKKVSLAKVVAKKQQTHVVAKKQQTHVVKKKVVKRTHSKPRLISKPTYGKGYGIQLIATTELNALKRYAKKHHVAQQAQFYTKKTKGKNWYMLVLGDYGSRQQAAKAQKTLSPALKKKKLWIRSVKGLKQVQ